MDFYETKNAASKAMKRYDGLFGVGKSITVRTGQEFIVAKGPRGGKTLVTPHQFNMLTKNKKQKMNGNHTFVPSLQAVVHLREAISRIPQCMNRLGSQPLVEWYWNTDHGCYEQNDRGYIELDLSEQEAYELKKEGFQTLKKLSVSLNPKQRLSKALMQVIAGEDTFGLIFPYNETNLNETSQSQGLEALFLKAVKEIPNVSYKVLPVLIHEKHMCTCGNDDNDEEDFENDCGCNSDVYAATPEDIQYSLSQAGKKYLMDHPCPLGGGGTINFYSLGDFGYAWKEYFWQDDANNTVKERIILQRAIVVTSWSATDRRTRKYVDTGKVAKEK